MTSLGNSLEEYLDGSLEILAESLALVRAGRASFYRVAALQLRLLLCDTTRRHNDTVNISLLPRVRPGVRLPALAAGGLLPLDAWLEQPLPLTPPLTVRQFIRRICDQDGGAHADPRPDAVLPPQAETVGYIVRLGECVVDGLKASA